MSRLIHAAAWGLPVLWTILWGLHRGEYAHGGYHWWLQVQMGGLTLLVLAAIVARTYAWRLREVRLVLLSSLGHVLGHLALIALVIVASWLSFQVGYARHHATTSVDEFLWQDP